jgi:beta-galactosidase
MSFSKRIFLLLSLITLFSSFSKSQIIFKEVPDYQIKSSDSLFFDITQTRNIIPLDGMWWVYQTNAKKVDKVSVTIPSIFEGEGDLTFEKEFTISNDDYQNKIMTLHFMGLNYSADIFINNINIYRHTGGDFPFSLILPKDILNYNQKNILTVKLHYKLDSKNTIPVKQRFLFPQSYGGIFRDVYIKLVPNVSISNLNVNTEIDFKYEKAVIGVSLKITDNNFKIDSLTLNKDYKLTLSIIDPEGHTAATTDDKFKIQKGEESDFSKEMDLRNPTLWSPSEPNSYKISAKISFNDQTIDTTAKAISIYSLTVDSNAFKLNNKKFTLAGVTYIPSFNDHGSLLTYDDMEKNIKIIKNTGFNAVRFAKYSPNPYYLELCRKYGLLAFIELPLNFIPGTISAEKTFEARCENYLNGFLNAYLKYPAVAAVGVGSSFNPSSDQNISLAGKLAKHIKSRSNILTYCSFDGFDISPIKNLDMYGIEFFNSSLENKFNRFSITQAKMGKGRVFISGATYPVNTGKTDGYVNEYSYEAQAKYFNDLIDSTEKDSVSGYFINTMFNYQGDFPSLIAGYNTDNIYNIGILNNNQSMESLSYKVIYSKLHNGEKITIPIGSEKNNAPMEFIIFGILLAILLGIIVNSGRKFREDASRSLMRPYNFFADVRDQRIISGFHTTILGIIIAAVLALLTSNVLFYLKLNLEWEKILISTGNIKIVTIVSYLSWHPLTSLLYLTIFYMAILLLLTIIIKIASFFVRNIVFYLNVYFTVIWSFLPLVLLIPIGIILYRILIADVANIYIYLLLIFFGLWVFYRLIKGIYVTFDVNPGNVYFYSIIIVLLICISFTIYLQIKNSFFDYFLYTLKQF